MRLEENVSILECRNCAECCKGFPYVELSIGEIQNIAEFTRTPSHEFTFPKGNDVEEYFLHFKENGHCFFLQDDNGTYSCSVYGVRPAICRTYPSNPKQKRFCDGCQTVLRNRTPEALL